MRGPVRGGRRTSAVDRRQQGAKKGTGWSRLSRSGKGLAGRGTPPSSSAPPGCPERGSAGAAGGSRAPRRAAERAWLGLGWDWGCTGLGAGGTALKGPAGTGASQSGAVSARLRPSRPQAPPPSPSPSPSRPRSSRPLAASPGAVWPIPAPIRPQPSSLSGCCPVPCPTPVQPRPRLPAHEVHLRPPSWGGTGWSAGPSCHSCE